MAYDEELATRVRDCLGGTAGLTERRMFGGLCFLLRGHMTAGIVGRTLMLRVGPERFEEALAQPHARVMDFTGRPMRGMLYVDPPGIASKADLSRWLGRATAFVAGLPAKPAAGARRPPPRRGRRT